MNFGVPIEEVLSWPIKKILEHMYFMKQWYTMKYGSMEDVDLGDNIPKLPHGGIPKVPKSPRAMKRASRGASGHLYGFK